ncbi:MAG: Crp/Fnr family transcriptional regulator [Cyclobacteriaceae bacterium]
MKNNLINHFLYTNFNFSSEVNNEISCKAKLTTISKRDLIKVSGTPEPKTFLVLQGLFRMIEVDEDGNQETAELLSGGDIFYSSVLDGRTNDRYVQALSNSGQLALINQNELDQITSSYHDLALEVSRIMDRRIKKLQRRVSYLTCNDMEGRLTSFLAELAGKEGVLNDDKVVVNNFLTHNEIAEIVNMSRQTVTSVLNKLRMEGKIAYNRKVISLLDKEITSSLHVA